MELNIFVYNEEPNINIENSFYISLLFIKKQVKLINDMSNKYKINIISESNLINYLKKLNFNSKITIKNESEIKKNIFSKIERNYVLKKLIEVLLFIIIGIISIIISKSIWYNNLNVNFYIFSFALFMIIYILLISTAENKLKNYIRYNLVKYII